ncbi:hypothetical protein GH975_06905 [Litorivicinus lipolyticus]|uniref:DUF4345 domain-containing protein n=1 Tax=Litorivicinus lipolyticus TaxID=418701 RepID=A0A5Q2QH21_9GAMM|nr:hypothetical protein [Litorivicinus lipolyticus]QGG80315.1 hypothetical protein GH975_06905 [Litorivicinus lipolyticus]
MAAVLTRLFLGVQGLIALAVGLLCAFLSDWSILGVSAEGAGRIELKVAIGGTWVFLGVHFLSGAMGSNLRAYLIQLASLYGLLAATRLLAMQSDSASMNTLLLLGYELVSAAIALVLFARSNPDRRRIFGG